MTKVTRPTAAQKVVLEAASEVAAVAAAAAMSVAVTVAATAAAAALVILPQSQRIYLGHLLRTAEAGKYNSQNLWIGYILVACEVVEADRVV